MFGFRCIARWPIHVLCVICVANASAQLLLLDQHDTAGAQLSIEGLAAQADHAFSDTAVEANCQRPQSTGWQAPQATRSTCWNATAGAAPTRGSGPPAGFPTATNHSLFVLGIGLRL